MRSSLGVCVGSMGGLLHTWLNMPRNRLFRRALALCAQFCGRLSFRVPQWLRSSDLDSGTRHTVASATVTCLRHSSNGRPI